MCENEIQGDRQMQTFRTGIIGLLTTLFLCALALHISAQQDGPIRVSFVPDIPPHSYVDENGEETGIYLELFRLIAEREGWEYELVRGSWVENYNLSLEGGIDLLVAVNITDARREIFDFASEIVVNNWGQIISSSGEDFPSILDLDGQEVALQTNDQNADAFLEYATAFNVSVQPRYFPDYPSMLTAVNAGVPALGVISSRIPLNGYPEVRRTSILFNPSRATFAVPRGENPELLRVIDRYLAEWRNDDQSPYYRLLDRFFGITAREVSVLPPWVTPVLIAVFAAVAFSIIAIRLLTRRLSAANAALKDMNASLEAMVKERSDRLEKSMKEVFALEQMASLGRMVAGVAHEVNTPVGVALTAASYLHDHVAQLKSKYGEGTLSEEDFAAYMDSAVNSSNLISTNLLRAADLIQSFKEISVDRNVELPRIINLKKYGEGIVNSLYPKIKHTDIRCEFHGEDIDVNTAPGAISQIITNLFTNAVTHAFDEGRPGVIRITLDMSGEKHLRIRVRDDGRGVDAAIRDHMFEPFVTSRRAEGSTGIGLNVVYNLVVEGLHGDISVESSPGEGTEFTVVFPLSTDEPAPSGDPGQDR
jgi:signal transduction histidine kinase